MNTFLAIRLGLLAFFSICTFGLYAAITVDDEGNATTTKEEVDELLETQSQTATSLKNATRAENIARLKKSNSLNSSMWHDIRAVEMLYSQGKPYEALKKLENLEGSYRGHEVLLKKIDHLSRSLRNLPEHLQEENFKVPRASFSLLKNALVTEHSDAEKLATISMPQLVRQLNYLAEHWEAIIQRYGPITAHRITQGLLFISKDTEASAAIYSPLLIKQCADTLRIIHNHITHKRHHKAAPLITKLANADIYPPTLQIYHAYVLREGNQFESGLTKLQKLAAQFPQWEEPKVQQVYYLTEVARYDLALELIENELLNSKRPDLHFLYAASLTAQGQTSKSLEVLNEMTISHPRLLDLWLNEGNPLYEEMSENLVQLPSITP